MCTHIRLVYFLRVILHGNRGTNAYLKKQLVEAQKTAAAADERNASTSAPASAELKQTLQELTEEQARSRQLQSDLSAAQQQLSDERAEVARLRAQVAAMDEERTKLRSNWLELKQNIS